MKGYSTGVDLAMKFILVIYLCGHYLLITILYLYN